MPEFYLNDNAELNPRDTRGPERYPYNEHIYKLPQGPERDFILGYVECMFFTATIDDDGDKANSLGTQAMSADLCKRVVADCMAFIACVKPVLERAIEGDIPERENGYDWTRAGNDFWYTRNGHGCGYWDRGLGQIGDQLTAACKAWREIDMYLGDDGKLYLM